MKNNIPLLLSCLIVGTSLLHAQPPARPTIAHEAPASVVAGQPLRIVARVSSSDPLKEVNIHIAQSGGAAPALLPLRPAGAGVYSLQVNPKQFVGVEEFRYYLDARTVQGAFTETNWKTVQVIGSASVASGSQESSWKKPALVIGGAAVAIGAGVAIAGGGGSGDSSGEGGVDPADNIIVRTTSDQANGSAILLPRARIVDIGGDLAGRSITRVRVQLQFNAIDGGEETYEVSYNGSTVLTGRTGGSTSEQVDVVGTADTQVVIQVTDSVAVDGNQAFRWDATVTYFLE